MGFLKKYKIKKPNTKIKNSKTIDKNSSNSKGFKLNNRSFRLYNKTFNRTNNAVFNAMQKSDNITLNSISEVRDKTIIAQRTFNTVVNTGKRIYKVSKTFHTAGKKILRLSDRYKNDFKGNGLSTNFYKRNTFKSKVPKKPKSKKEGLFSNTKEAVLAVTRPEEGSTSNSALSAVHTAKEYYDKSEPVRKAISTSNRLIGKPLTRYAANKGKEITSTAVKNFRYKNLNRMGNQKSVLPKVFNFKAKNTAYRLKNNYKFNTRKSIKTVQRAGRTFRASANTVAKTAKGVVNVSKRIVSLIKTVANPLFLKGAAIAAAFIFVVIIINNYLSAATAPLTMFLMDKAVADKYKEVIADHDNLFLDKIAALSTGDEVKMNNLALQDAKFRKIVDSLKGVQIDSRVVKYKNEVGNFKTNWKEILCIMSVEKEQDLSFNTEEQNRVKELYQKFNQIDTSTETYYEQVGTDENDEPIYEERTRLIISVFTYGIGDTLNDLRFDKDQTEWVYRLINSDTSESFPGFNIENEINTPEQIKNLIQNAPHYNITREHIIETGTSLVGRVPYFWGGKSSPGWNDKWGTMQEVTAEGSPSTGETRPYGLDCSGFVDWTFKTAGAGYSLSGGTTSQWEASYPINEGDLIPGDLVFKQTPHTSGVNHVGIFIGYDTNGKKRFVHCASGTGVTVNDYSGFKYWRRPFVKLED